MSLSKWNLLKATYRNGDFVHETVKFKKYETLSIAATGPGGSPLVGQTQLTCRRPVAAARRRRTAPGNSWPTGGARRGRAHPWCQHAPYRMCATVPCCRTLPQAPWPAHDQHCCLPSSSPKPGSISRFNIHKLSFYPYRHMSSLFLYPPHINLKYLSTNNLKF